MTAGIPRPCIQCGTLVDPPASRCKLHRLKSTKRRTRSGQWDRLSKKLRAESPFCEVLGCTSTDLTVDHIIPITEAPEWEYEPLNLRVWCRSHNSSRKNMCTDEERTKVRKAVAAKRERRQRFYASQQGSLTVYIG